MQNALMRFSTSIVPDSATMLSATFMLSPIAPAKSADRLSLTGEWYNWGASIGAEGFSSAPVGAAFRVPVSALVSGDNTIALSAPATNVNLTGLTYRTHISQLPGDAPPTGVNGVTMGAFDNLTQPGSALEVCYTLGP